MREDELMPIARRQARRRTRKPYHHGSLRQALLDSALEIIEERGPSALSLREAASRAGVSHAAPKRHFATVADLYCAVAEDGYRALREHLLKRVAGQPDAAPLQALAILGVEYVEFAITNPGRFRAMFHSGMTDRTASHPLEDAAGSAFDVLVDAIERCQQAGEVRAGSPRELALSAWAIVHGLAVLGVDRQLANRGFSSDDPVMLAREVTQQLYLGLRPERGGQSND
jgi:AcrR family transcriptional regulator